MKNEFELPYESVKFKEGSHVKWFINTEADSYGAHWHVPMEIIMPLENGYVVVCGGVRRELNEGDIALVAPGAVHELEAPLWGRRLFLQADLSCFTEIRELDILFSLLPPLVVFEKEHKENGYDEAARCMETIHREQVSGGFYGELSVYAELFRMLSLAGRYFVHARAADVQNRPNARRYEERILSSCDYVNEHLSEPLTLEQAARASGFSKYHFAHLFREFMGISFYRYLNRKRIMNAQRLLADPDCSVTEAAMQSGFTSISSFNRMFRQIKGCTPTEYRGIYLHAQMTQTVSS